jgi:hypothetical protein
VPHDLFFFLIALIPYTLFAFMSTILCLDMPTEELQSNTDSGFSPAGPIVEQVDANL